MREGTFGSAEKDDRPIYVAKSRRDGGLCGNWQEAAETIAQYEGSHALRQRERLRKTPWRCGDGLEPGFVMVGRRKGLTAIAETATGIIDHGQAFRAWADLVGDNLEALGRFEEAFLGSWDSAAEFAGRLLDGSGLISTEASDESQDPQTSRLASDLADELQRRGEIQVVPNGGGGVWLFRSLARRPLQDEAGTDEGGDHA